MVTSNQSDKLTHSIGQLVHWCRAIVAPLGRLFQSGDSRGLLNTSLVRVFNSARAYMPSATPIIAVVTASLAIPSLASGDPIVRVANDAEQVQFALTLPLQNQTALAESVGEMYDPKSRNYHHFLTPEDFAAKYAPSVAAYSALKSFATSAGLTIVREPPGRTTLDVSGSVATVRRLFQSQMYWRQANDGKQYMWADREPVAPAALTSLGANAAVLRQMPPATLIRHRQPGRAAPNVGTGPGGSYVPNDIKTAYNLTTIQNGGTPVALYELSTANYSDPSVYASTYGLNNPTLIQKNVDGGTTSTAGAEEVMLDIEMVMAVSNPTSMYIYTGNPSGTGPLDTYQQIANDNLVGQVSSSWYTGCESDVGASTMNAENAVFTQMVAQGMAVFIAIGDSGAYNGSSVNCVTGSGIGPQLLDPASQPYITSAGGTTLTTSSAQAYISEAVWYDSPSSATGGGISSYWPTPFYQTDLSLTDTQFSTTYRNAPDMSLDADPDTGYYIYCSTTGGWEAGVGGTSAVAPQLAAFWGLVSKGIGRRLGFANPLIYSMANQSGQYAANFHDVTPNNLPNSNGYYDSFTGYDNATGLGSYNGANLYAALIRSARAIALVPIISLLLQ